MAKKRSKFWTIFHVVAGLCTGGIWWVGLLIYRTSNR